MDRREYTDEYHYLITKDPDLVLETWTEYDGEVRTLTVKDRLISVANVFAAEGWTMPSKLEKYWH